jgi:hypothetical protein
MAERCDKCAWGSVDRELNEVMCVCFYDTQTMKPDDFCSSFEAKKEE